MGSGKMRLRSSESGWVSQHSNEDGEGREEEDDGEEHRLIRTSPVIDPLDVEVLEVTGAQKDEHDEGVPSPELERSLKIKELLEASPRLKKLLLMLDESCQQWVVWKLEYQELSKARQSHKRIRVVCLETTNDNQRIVGLLIPNAAVESVFQDLSWVQDIDD